MKYTLDSKTTYTLNQKTGEGTITSVAGDLDRVADAVAQDVGFPIDYGSWEEKSRASREMTVRFAVTEECMASFRKAVRS